jgi:uncharacterized protein
MSSKFSTLALLAFTTFTLSAPLTGCGGDEVETGDEQNATATKGSFEVFESDVDGKWYFHLLASNGQIVLRSQAYTSESAAKKGVKSVQSNGKNSSRFELLTAVNGEFYLNVKASNGEIIATTETYTTKSNAERAQSRIVDILKAGASIKNADLASTGFQLFECGAKEFCFRLRAGNGEIVLQSEVYSSESAAKAGIDSVKANGARPEQFEVVESTNGKQAWFRLRASSAVPLTSQQIVGKSQMYASAAGARKGVEAVVKLLATGSDECVFANEDGTFSIFDELSHLEYGKLINVDAETDLTSLEVDQIWAAVNVHFPSEEDTDEQDVFSFFDDNSLIIRSIENPATGRAYTALEFTSGDTPLATVFVAGSAEDIVLTTGDQDITTCTEF